MTIRIDGTTYNIPVKEVLRKADFLDKYAERTQDGTLHRELIGVYFNYELTFGRCEDPNVYADLWDRLSEPKEFHTVVVPDESGDFTFQAYFAGIADRLRKQKDTANYWQDLTVKFIAKSPERTP